jgi:hypothetical protein
MIPSTTNCHEIRTGDALPIKNAYRVPYALKEKFEASQSTAKEQFCQFHIPDLDKGLVFLRKRERELLKPSDRC